MPGHDHIRAIVRTRRLRLFGHVASSIAKSLDPSAAILQMVIILVLHGVVFPVVHAPVDSTKSGMILDSHHWMRAPVLQTGLIVKG